MHRVWQPVSNMQLPPPDTFADDGVAVVISYLRSVAVPRWWLTFAGMCLSTAGLAALGVGSRSRPASAGPGQGPQLPVDLRVVSVLGARYEIDVFSGTVLSEKTWIETRTEPTYVGGQWQQAGPLSAPWGQPGYVVLTTKTTRKDNIVLRHPDGTHSAWHFTNTDLIVAQGQTVTLLARTTRSGACDCLVGYNDDTRQLSIVSFVGAHSIAGLTSWLAAIAIGAAGFVWGWQAAIQSFMGQAAPGVSASPPGLYIWGVMAGCAAVVALVPLVVAQLIVPALRTAIFKRRYLPGILNHLRLNRGGVA